MDTGTLWPIALSAGLVGLTIYTLRMRRRQRVRDRRHFALIHGVSEFALDAMRAALRRELIAVRDERGVTGTLEPMFRAHHGEDLLLWRLFGDKPRGRYIEVGAHDGVLYSVSYAFECAGWSGVLIEASPKTCAHCASVRKGSTVVHAACVAPGAGPTVPLEVAVHADWVEDPGVLTHVGEQATHLKSIRKKPVETERHDVPAKTMTEILSEAGSDEPYDFAVLDVEGHEAALLEGWDMDKFPARVVLVEELTKGGVDEIHRILSSRGYIKVGRYFSNDLYIKEGENELIARGRDAAARWKIWG